MKIFIITLLALLLAAPALAADAASVQMLVIDQDPKGTNVRDTPGGKIIQTIPYGDSDEILDQRAVNVTGRKNDWFSVVLPDGKTGWMHKSVLGSCASATEDGDPWLQAKPEDGPGLLQIKSDTPLQLVDVQGTWAKVSFKDAAGKTRTGWLPEQCRSSNPYNDCWKK